MNSKEWLRLLLMVLTLTFSWFSTSYAATTHYYWINMSQGYSSNIGREPKPLEKEEFITNLGLGFSSKRIGEKWNLDFTYNPNAIRYWKEVKSTDIIHNLSSTIKYSNMMTRSSTFNFQLSDKISRQKKTERGTEGVKDWTHENNLSVVPSLTYNISKNTNLDTIFHLTKVDSFSRERQDYLNYGVTENFKHSFTFNPRLSSSISLSYAEIDWEISEDSISTRGNLNFTYQLSPLTKFMAGSGHEKRETKETNKKISTANYQINMDKMFTRFTVLSLSYNRGISDDIDTGAIYRYDRVSGNLRHYVTERDSTSVSAYSENRNSKLGNFEEELSGITINWKRTISHHTFLSLSGGFGRLNYFGSRLDESLRLTALISNQLTQRLFISFDYSYIENNSNELNFEYVENLAFLNLQWATGKFPGTFQYFGRGEIR